MFVDSTLQVYTTIVAWIYYDLIWTLLVATGLVFVPIVMAIIGTAISVRGEGSTTDNSGDRILSAIEIRLLTLFIVLFFVAIPVNFVQLNSGSVQTYENVNDLRAPPDVVFGASCGNTGSAYDAMESPAPDPICSSSSGVPLWWFAVLRISHAITQTVVNEVTAQNNSGMRALVSFAQGAIVQSSTVRSLLNQFHGQCYDKALARFSQESSGQIVGPGNEDPGFFGRDTSWIGSSFWVEFYYNNTMTDAPIPGMPFIPELNPQFEAGLEPEIGRQNCGVFWAYLSDQVAAEALSPAAGDNRAGFWSRLTNALTFDSNQDKLVRLYLRNTPVESQQTLDRIDALRKANASLIQRGLNAAGEVAQGAEFANLAFKASLVTSALLKVLPVIQAYMLMFIVFMLPFGLVLSGYSWSFVIQSSVLMFFVIFWSALWGFAAWIDESMARALWPGGDDGIFGAAASFLDGDGVSSSINKLIHSIVTAAVYLLAPVYAGFVLAAADFRVAGLAGNQLGAAGPSGGGANALNSAGRQARKALNKGKGKDKK